MIKHDQRSQVNGDLCYWLRWYLHISQSTGLMEKRIRWSVESFPPAIMLRSFQP